MKLDHKDSDLLWTRERSETIIKDEWIEFRREAYRFPDGSIYEPYYTYSRRDYVVIVASDTENRYITVRQYRQGIHELTNEFPAGGIEKKDRDSRDPSVINDAMQAARRELLEETGYEAGELHHLISIPSNATLADNYAHVFEAMNCRKVSGQSLDEMEFINVELRTKDEIEELIRTGEFKQAIHVMAWLMAERR